MSVYGVWVGLTGLTRAMIRLATVLMTPTGSLTVRSGVIPGGTPLLLTGTAMTGTVAPGRAVVQGTTPQGAYPVVNDSPFTFTVAPGHTSLARVDTVWAVALDHEHDSSGQRVGQIVYQQGTPGAGAPAAPPTGTAYLRLWDIAVPANASAGAPINWASALTDQRVYTVPLGGITPGPAVGAYPGQWRDGGGATGILERFDGTDWLSRIYLGILGRLVFGGDTALYRGGANSLKTDGTLQAVGMASTAVENTSSTLINSATFVSASIVLTATAVVPPSGKLQIAGSVRHDIGSGYYSFSSFLVTGSASGTIFAPSDVICVMTGSATSYMQQGGSLSIRVTGQPGETITVAWRHKVDTAGVFATIYARTITINPLLG
ncbi:hypothetical protein ACFVFS_17255 [Kitasatospora sp. NPDC057692]|uniref:hypothetical protein n=1 Tax=Kitasatospora sp. NPDC057692 TaxID=3346215 RepID=UPI0036CE72E8